MRDAKNVVATRMLNRYPEPYKSVFDHAWRPASTG